MSTLTIKAPVPVQVYRLFFAASAMYFISILLRLPFFAPLTDFLALGIFTFCDMLGFDQTWIRTPRSRWALALLGILVPVLLFVGMPFKVWGRPEAWRDWLMGSLILFAFSIIPVTCAAMLFVDKKTNDYFRVLAA